MDGFAYELGFQERMELGRDAARSRDYSRLGARVSRRLGPLRVYRSVSEVAAELGISEARVKLLCKQGRLQGAKRQRGKGSGRGTAWRIPAWLQDGRYLVILTPGKRGRALTSAPHLTLTAKPGDVVPF